MKVWIDGTVVNGNEARIPVTDHGLLYGDGVFEGIRVTAGRVFRLDAHLTRLEASARAIALEIPVDRSALRDIVLNTVRAHGQLEAYVRLLITRGEGELGIDPATCPQPRIVCIVDRVRIYGEEQMARGIDLATSSWRRPPADVLDTRVKSLNYLNSILARVEARRAGADEALLLNASGAIAEASVANVFAVRDGELRTPPTSDGALEGITRCTILDLAGGLGIPARECRLTRYDLFSAEEAFLTGSGAGLVPVRSLDGRTVGGTVPGPVFAKLRSAFAEAAASLGTPALP
jgi:branched-chain amino acid aminotransferase